MIKGLYSQSFFLKLFQSLLTIVMKGLKSFAIASSCYPGVQHRETFYSVFLLSEKVLCRWAMPYHWLTDKSGKSEHVASASYMSCSKHERKGGGNLSGSATADVQEHSTSQQKVPFISTYQCEEQTSLFLFYCHIDISVTYLNSRELDAIHLPLILPSFPSIFIPEIISTSCPELPLFLLASRYSWDPKMLSHMLRHSHINIRQMRVSCLVPLHLFKNLMKQWVGVIDAGLETVLKITKE